MSTNLERFKAIVERGFSQGDLTVADEVCAEKLIEHEYLAKIDIPGPQILKAQIEDARHSIKDLKLTIEAIVEANDTESSSSIGGCQTDLHFSTKLERSRLRPNDEFRNRTQIGLAPSAAISARRSRTGRRAGGRTRRRSGHHRAQTG